MSSLLRSLDYAADKCKFDFDEVYKIIRPNLAHFNRHIRRSTISILAKLSQNSHFYDLVAAERTTPDLNSYREKLNLFRKFIPSKCEQNDVFYLMMFGQLYINFNLIMPEVKRMLIADLERSFESETGTGIFLHNLKVFCEILHFPKISTFPGMSPFPWGSFISL